MEQSYRFFMCSRLVWTDNMDVLLRKEESRLSLRLLSKEVEIFSMCTAGWLFCQCIVTGVCCHNRTTAEDTKHLNKLIRITDLIAVQTLCSLEGVL